MKLETFFDKFDQITNNHAAIDKVRELIMSSAFCGGFSKEERSLALPKEWSTEEKPELPNIPSSWKWEKGCDVFEVIRGLSYQKNDSRDSATEGFSPVLRANNIGKSINFSDLVYVRTEKIRSVQLVRRNDILIAMSSGSKRLVGKAAPMVTDFKGSFGAFCGIIRNKSGIQNEFLARYFQSPQYTSWVVAAGRGVGINNLRREDLDSIPVPTPPAEVQISIVAKVDELMALCDRLEAQLKERDVKQAALAKAALAKFTEDPTPENLQLLFHPSFSIEPNNLREAILQLAITGRLSSQKKDEYAPSNDQLELANTRICKQQQIRVQKPVVSSFIEPFGIPCNWRWVPLGNTGVHQTGTTPSKNSPDLFNGPVPFIKPSDISPSGINYSNESLSQKGADEFGRTAPSGSLLMVCIGTIGKSNLITKTCSFNQQINALTPCDYVHPDYLLAACRSRYFIDAAWGKSTSTTIALLNKSNWSEIPFPLAPLQEQIRIAARIEELTKLVDRLEAQLEASRTTGEKLLEALVAELTAD